MCLLPTNSNNFWHIHGTIENLQLEHTVSPPKYGSVVTQTVLGGLEIYPSNVNFL